jgi:ABC-type Fe3+ transport system permease subunit
MAYIAAVLTLVIIVGTAVALWTERWAVQRRKRDDDDDTRGIGA